MNDPFWEANRIGFSVPNLRAVLTYARETPHQVADWLLACCRYLFWPEQARLDIAEWPNVSRWLDRIRALPGWAAPYDLLR